MNGTPALLRADHTTVVFRSPGTPHALLSDRASFVTGAVLPVDGGARA